MTREQSSSDSTISTKEAFPKPVEGANVSHVAGSNQQSWLVIKFFAVALPDLMVKVFRDSCELRKETMELLISPPPD